MASDPSGRRSSWQVFLIFLRLGLTSFGGPVAHLGYFRDEFVTRRKWFTEQGYADLVALCQFMPGPASSQVGLAIGMTSAGYRGALAAWLGFTMPSALALILFALGIGYVQGDLASGALQGLKIVAVAVVAQAVWGMGQKLCPDKERLTIMAAVTCILLFLPSAWTQVAVILLAAGVGVVLFRPQAISAEEHLPLHISRRAGVFALFIFAALLVGLPLLVQLVPNQSLALFDSFYRSGSLVFGGGHVVLPLLQAEVVPTGWVNKDAFLAGYGAAQAVPGPLFTFAAFLGAAMTEHPTGWLGGLLCLVAIFTPSFLLVAGVLPFWDALRKNPRVQAALMGINAGVVGLLLAALYQPVWSSAVKSPQDFGFALLALVALMAWKLPPWFVVIVAGIMGWLLAL